MTILDDVAAYIEANTTGWTVGGTTGNLSLGQMLDSQPDTQVALYVQPGLQTAYAFSTSAQVDRVYEQPNLQALSRSTSPALAESNLIRIYNLLDGLANTTMGTTRYLEFEAVQPPFQLGRDENERHMWSVNFTVKKDV